MFIKFLFFAVLNMTSLWNILGSELPERDQSLSPNFERHFSHLDHLARMENDPDLFYKTRDEQGQ